MEEFRFCLLIGTPDGTLFTGMWLEVKSAWKLRPSNPISRIYIRGGTFMKTMDVLKLNISLCCYLKLFRFNFHSWRGLYTQYTWLGLGKDHVLAEMLFWLRMHHMDAQREIPFAHFLFFLLKTS